MGSHSVEDIKRASRGLRGSLVASLADSATGGLREDDLVLIKLHGSYQQDDRDLREARRQARLEPAHSFMIRTRTPGGVVTPRQWLQLDAIATTYAERGLRITTRQAFQFHGVIKSDLKKTMQAINAAMIDTIAACGDVTRNIAVAANPQVSAVHARVHADAAGLSTHLLPRTRAYHEIWLDEQPVVAAPAEDEPIYGQTYLPRKFKIGFAVPPRNDVDVFSQDLGFIAIVEDGALVGYNATIGGGMGMTHGDPDTYPRLGDVLGFLEPSQLVVFAEAVVTTQRDFGNRQARKRARLKYTVDDHGLDTIRAEIERRAGFALAPARAFGFEHNGDRFGWTEGEDGRGHLTLRIVAGRIVDGEGVTHLTGLREIAAELEAVDGAEFRMTPNQNLTIANIPPELRASIDARVARHGLDGHRSASPLRLNALACVALPTCGLAMAEAERYLPRLLDEVEGLLGRHGLLDAPIHLRISGCPNGCSRPYLGEIALVGKAPGRYNLMLGADHRGQRLNTLYRENIDEAAILEALDPLLARYATERGTTPHGTEGFGDFLLRTGVVAPPARRIDIEVTA
ncbi:assimilatory sulfite reductase (NADPH) hemoprotein subunit [Novilysobacter spongiicola]|uniref:Sulfite reductase [NADPH] hemoprotein beta-component n=1 Tax=Lysobacter spongiicola DSM 21749 TaxID=1122188 RepID=A0A1T4P6L8_9GAMM|nr:assimilatory sulfite reductase (NADPH) hemoprotein subunit [Lysobacter spongiicola]SJZ87225.1 sulfite reductase (NADPH) hemoprotein beta-component [Lysobacter spongiicola DSM 21749]